MTGHALRAPPERRDRTLAHFVGAERGDERQAAAALFRRGGARRLRRDCGTRNAAGATARTRRFVVVGFLYGDGGARSCAPLGRAACFFGAEPFLGFLFGLALGFFVVAVAFFFLALARFGGVALDLVD